MATRHCQPTDRARLQLPGSVPVAGFVVALAASPIMLEVVLITTLLPLIGTLVSSRPPSRTGLTDTDNETSHEEHWPVNVTGATPR